jgi:hypothetical protein
MNGSKQKLWAMFALVLAAAVLFLAGSRVFLQPETANREATSPAENGGEAASSYDAKIRDLEEKIARLSRQLDEQSSQSPASVDPAEVERLRQRVDELSGGVLAGDANRNPEDFRQLQAAARDPEVQQRYRDYLEDQKYEQQARIAEQFAAEREDAAWARGTRDDLEAAFDTPELSQARQVSSECKTSMCRVEFTMHPGDLPDSGSGDAEFENELLARLTRDLPSGNMKRDVLDDGSVQYTLHLFRPGHQPPPTPSLAGMSVEEIKEVLQIP